MRVIESLIIDVQYSQKAAFSFEKGSNGQNYSSFSIFSHPVSHPPTPTPPLQQNLWFPHPLKAIWKTLSLVVSKLDFACTGSRLFPGRWGYEFAFEFMNLLLKIKGGRQKTKFYFFYSLKCFFHWDSLHAGMYSHYKACSYKKNKNKKETHTGNLFRKNLQLIGVC